MINNKILIVDDEKDICELLVGIFDDKGFKSTYVTTSEEAIETFKRGNISLILLDIWLNNSKFDGFQTLEKILQINESVPVIMISGHGNIETAVNSIKKGAYDFIEKPFDSELLIFKIKKALENFKLKKRIQQLIRKDYESKIIFSSDKMKELMLNLKKISKTDSSVILTGTNGCGKTFIAKQIHNESNRKTKNFRIVDCKSKNKQFEIELFGNEVNQITELPGLLDEINGGTILFKNFDSLHQKIQGKILRIMEEEKYFRIGGHIPRVINFRIMATTNLSYSFLKSKKKIRLDLLKKIDFFELKIPKFSERNDDIIEIVKIFLSEFNSNNLNTKTFSDEVLNFIKNLNHLENFSQLKKLVEWIAIMMEEKNEEIVTINMIEDLIRTFLNHDEKTLVPNELMDFQLKTARENFERDYLIHNLKKYNYNISKMSSKIGMERTALYRKLKSMKIKTDLKG